MAFTSTAQRAQRQKFDYRWRGFQIPVSETVYSLIRTGLCRRASHHQNLLQNPWVDNWLMAIFPLGGPVESCMCVTRDLGVYSRAVGLESVTWDSSRLESVILRLETWLKTWAFGLETWLVTWRLGLGLDSRLAANDLDHKSKSQGKPSHYII